ncbi:transcriptional regulator [Clostridium sp. 19966]|uniref:FeoC-like transcriptional regulator n=1 Tax=Clostridium sp. 19966 TaxID=2768166 RepID=UPI0028DEE76B|nr:FeoC-like transcriptional regulator [Clostridium sp. 19966]MDT8715186.1 transcriptional regulator [Clostridium sp. 19966]
MLMKVLKKLFSGERYSNHAIAEELNIDEGLVEHMIIQLQHMGYIEKEEKGGAACSCSGCSPKKKASCCSSSNIQIGMWILTQKGKNALQSM